MFERIASGRTDLVHEYLRRDGASATDRDSSGVSLLQWCAYHGDPSAIRFLLDRGAALASLGTNYDLNGAAFHGHWQLCEFLIENGSKADQPLPDTGETPLHAALCKANRPVYEHVVQVLLAHGADPNVATKPAVETGGFMRDARTRGETPLHRAAAFGTERCIRLLLDAGADREARDAHGESPLSWASWHLRPAGILRMLCFGEHRVHADNDSDYDHGAGWSQIDPYRMAKPIGD